MDRKAIDARLVYPILNLTLAVLASSNMESGTVRRCVVGLADEVEKMIREAEAHVAKQYGGAP